MSASSSDFRAESSHDSSKRFLKNRLKALRSGQSNRNSEKANQQKKESLSIPVTRWINCSSTSNGTATSISTYSTEPDLESEMDDLARYFDYEAFGRELFMYDYSMGANNNVFRDI